MGLNVVCRNFGEKFLKLFCRGKCQRDICDSLPTIGYGHYADFSYAIFNVENNTDTYFITLGESHLLNLDWFYLNEYVV
ncbi:uncharacterized protein Dwil_GK28008 [Drosophila willistoni]|uniref:Uncharacterized protein n=1 Tax=Drosophila willistoni TaxID=7260 RepID=A0A0Q9X3C8_DROWI|nr:uncharacterized protein Dwil_GK28008 [Drosophila willistoni]